VWDLQVDGAWVRVRARGEGSVVDVLDSYFMPEVPADALHSACFPGLPGVEGECLAPRISLGGVQVIESDHELPLRRSGRLLWSLPEANSLLSAARKARVLEAVKRAIPGAEPTEPRSIFDGAAPSFAEGLIQGLYFVFEGGHTVEGRIRAGVRPNLIDLDRVEFPGRALLSLPFSSLRAWDWSDRAPELGAWVPCLENYPVRPDRPYCWDVVTDSLLPRLNAAYAGGRGFEVHFDLALAAGVVSYHFEVRPDGRVSLVGSVRNSGF
jgi:hypothetical protein